MMEGGAQKNHDKKLLFKKKGVANEDAVKRSNSDLVSEQVELYQTIVYKNPDYCMNLQIVEVGTCHNELLRS